MKLDQEKIFFITDFRTYCFMVMPFNLNNARKIYQRMINKVFQSLIGDVIKAYIDDMVAKVPKQLIMYLIFSRCFDVAYLHRLIINPENCVFGIFSGNFLVFMITQRCIEANPDKI